MFSIAESGDWRQGRDVCFCNVVTAALVLTPCPILPDGLPGLHLKTSHGLWLSAHRSRAPCFLPYFQAPWCPWSILCPFRLISWPASLKPTGELRLSQAPSCLNTLPSHLCLISIFQVDMRGREGGSQPNTLSLTQNLNRERKEPTDSTYGEVLFFSGMPLALLIHI